MLASCVGDEEYKIADFDGSFAIPLVDSDIKIVDIAERTQDENLDIVVDDKDRMTLIYNGEVITQTSTQIFGTFPYNQFTEITDSISPIDFPVPEPRSVNRAVFNGTQILFYFESVFTEDINIKIELPQILKDGNPFTASYNIPYEGEATTVLLTDSIDMTGWEINTMNNFLSSRYDARLPNGERVELQQVSFFLDEFNFSYVEGFFGSNTAPLSGDVITVGVFNKWLSGGLTFEDPRVNFQVENSFGFPVRSKVNEITIKTISGNEFMLEGSAVEEGLLFDYPSLDEVGQVKLTDFNYDNTNSNLGEIFNEKAESIFYDVSAIANSPDDEEVIGFLTDESYYKVKVALEIPLFCKLNDLKLTDTFDLDLTKYTDINSAEFKLITENSFPFNIDLTIDLLDENGTRLGQLYKEGDLLLESAILKADGVTEPIGKIENTKLVSDALLEAVLQTKKIAVVSTFSNSAISPDEAFWILSAYGLNLQLGLILNNEQ